MRFFLSFALLLSLMVSRYAVSAKPTACGKPAFPTPPVDFYLHPLPKDQFTLIQAHVFFRHGDRLPWKAQQCWTADELLGKCDYTDYMEPAFGQPLHSPDRKFVFRRKYDDQNDCEVGQLTTYGYWQEYNNGKILKKAYIEDTPLVGKVFNTSQVLVRSTNVHRTVDSTEAVVSAMFEGEGHGVQFVDIHTHDAAYDLLRVNDNLIASLKQNVTSVAGYQEWYESSTLPVMKKIQNVLGIPVTSLDFVEEMFDCTTVHICHAKSTPFDDDLIQEIAKVYTEWFIWMYSYPTPVDLGKLSSGYVMNFMGEKMKESIANPEAPKLYLNCGHDTGPMMSLLVALDLPIDHWPAYSSMFSFELWQEQASNEYFVRILYDGVPQVPAQCKSVSGKQQGKQSNAEGLCTLNEFQSIVSMFQSSTVA